MSARCHCFNATSLLLSIIPDIKYMNKYGNRLRQTICAWTPRNSSVAFSCWLMMIHFHLLFYLLSCLLFCFLFYLLSFPAVQLLPLSWGAPALVRGVAFHSGAGVRLSVADVAGVAPTHRDSMAVT